MPVKSANVAQEYIKNKDLSKDDVRVLMQWADKQAHLPEMSELQIINFLQSCYCNMEAAKRAVETFFCMKAHCPQFFRNRDPNDSTTKTHMDCGCYTKLPNATAEGYSVMLFTFMQDDPNKFGLAEQVKIFDMIMRLWLEEYGTTRGLLIIIDIKKFGLGHLAKLGLFDVRDFLMYLQEALPVRLKGLHFVNANSIMDKLMLLMKPFLKKELSEMLYIHKDVSDTLFKFVPKECLPKDYGGNGEELNAIHDAMKQKLFVNAEFFLKDEKQLADESRRESKHAHFILQEYGLDGSFKKLEID